MIYFLRAFFRELKLMYLAKKKGYYTHIDFLPVWNWFEISKGNLEYLYKKDPVKFYPEYFKKIPLEMLFQFEYLDTTYFQKMQQLAYLRALYATTKRFDYLNKANSLEHEIKKESSIENKKATLNEMCVFIEEAFKNIGAIDVQKMSTSKFFALYYRAIEKNKKGNGNN